MSESSTARFDKRVRLTQASEYSYVFAQNHSQGGRGFVVLAAGNSVGHPRLGLAIAKKAVKLSTKRNEVKRIVREAFRHLQTDLPACDYVVLARHGLADMSKAEMRQSIEWIFSKLAKKIVQETSK